MGLFSFALAPHTLISIVHSGWELYHNTDVSIHIHHTLSYQGVFEEQCNEKSDILPFIFSATLAFLAGWI